MDLKLAVERVVGAKAGIDDDLVDFLDALGVADHQGDTVSMCRRVELQLLETRTPDVFDSRRTSADVLARLLVEGSALR